MGATVLVLGDGCDPHVETVCLELRALGATALVVERASVHRGLRLSYAFGDTDEVWLQGEDWETESRRIDAVWWRVKPYEIAEDDLAGVAAAFVDREWKRALEALSELLAPARWMNRRAADQRARSKPLQLQLARACGLTLPQTLVSNDPERIRAFVGAAPAGVVYKTLSWFFAPPDQTIFTSMIAPEDLKEETALRLAPGIFQHRLPKAYEVRATVVNGELHAVAIDSQAHPEACLDWRRVQQELTYERVRLPSVVADRLCELTNRLGLVFAAHDLVVTPEGEHVFLEVNSLGQWLWLERRVEVPIAAAVARWLAGPR